MKVDSAEELFKMILGDQWLYSKYLHIPGFKTKCNYKVCIIMYKRGSFVGTIANISTLRLHMAYCNYILPPTKL